MTVYMIRHGESETNKASCHAGQLDAPLTENGKAQAQALVDQLSDICFDRVYSSDLSRARSTAELALGGKAYTTDARLREIDVGSLEGRPLSECREEYGEEYIRAVAESDMRPYGGECRADMLARFTSFLNELSSTEYDTVALFCHGGIMTTALEYVLGVAVPHRSVAAPNCMIAVFELVGGRLRLVSWNAQTPKALVGSANRKSTIV